MNEIVIPLRGITIFFKNFLFHKKFLRINTKSSFTIILDIVLILICVENHLKYIIDLIMNYGYTKEEAINILDGKNSDGSEFIQLPF